MKEWQSMRYPSFLCLLLLVVSSCLLRLDASETQTRAFFNPRISSRNLAMNQHVVIRFTTLRPQVEDVDPLQQVLSALAQPAARESWRVWGEPTVEVDPKIGTLQVQIALIPRQSGMLELPDIPVRWLTGNQVARFGEVEVQRKLAYGARYIDLPADYRGVQGFAWGMSYDDLLEATGQEWQAQAGPNIQGEFSLSLPSGLELIVRAGRLASARIHAPELVFSQARGAFQERWGDSLPSRRSDAALWIIGWIRIEAMAMGEGTVVHLSHEGIEADISRGAVQRQVFSLLDSRGAAPSGGVDEQEEEAPTRAPVLEAPVIDPEAEAAAEFERQMRR